LCGNLGFDAQKKATANSSNNHDTHQSNNNNAEKEQIQQLDTLAVEQERGITVKAATASMLYRHSSAVGPHGVLLLNMIDTPGHSDFGREVTRSLTFVDGAILLLDATQGIQAQTWTVYDKAKSLPKPPALLTALTKIDLDAARPIHVALTACEWLKIDDPDTIIPTSARNRIGITQLLDAICTQVPSPEPPSYNDANDNTPPQFHAQVVDSWYTRGGVNCIIKMINGQIQEGDRIKILGRNDEIFTIQEIGIVLPKPMNAQKLIQGQMGYVRFGLKNVKQANPGTVLLHHEYDDDSSLMSSDTATTTANLLKSVLFASVHPNEVTEFEDLCVAIEKLAMNDTGLDVTKVSFGSGNNANGGPFLGPGLRIGFQGLLHVEVFRQRLLDEFNMDAIVTPPKVPYHVTIMPSKTNNLVEPTTTIVEDLSEWPGHGIKFKVQEPVSEVRIMAPMEYAGAIMELISRKRGTEIQTQQVDEDTWIFQAKMPWAEVVVNFHDMLKNITAGYGSLDTFEADPPLQEANLSKVDILLNDENVGPLAFVCHKDNSQSEARVVCKKLQEVLPRQQFVTVIQAKADGKIIASERIKAYRKDVLVKSGKMVGGGDVTRKKKLLEAQKRGKKRQQQSGKVMLSQSAFNSVITRSS